MRRKDIKDNPNLRFPEFTEPYIYKRFGELLVKEARSFKMEDESAYRLVTVKRGYGGVVLRGIFKGKEVLVKSQFFLKTGDFLISKRQICHNACGIVPPSLEGAIVSNEYTVFLPKKDLDIVYFRYFCCLPLVSHTFFLSSIGVHIEKMLFKVDDWLKWEFPVPTLPEQQKIASFLAAVDKKIEQLSRKKELLEQYKKGVMQKIFSQEIRFKDENGQDYPDWEEKNFGEIASRSKAKHNPKLSTEDYHCVELESIAPNQGKLLKVFNANKQKSIKNKFNRGEVLFGKLRPNLRKYLYTSFEGVCSSEIWVLKGKDVINKFLFYLVQTNQFYHISNITFGSKMPRADWNFISSFPFIFPSKKEQKKIANFISAVDDKIKSVQTQLAQTKNFKKGLLQKMFV